MNTHVPLYYNIILYMTKHILAVVMYNNIIINNTMYDL